MTGHAGDSLTRSWDTKIGKIDREEAKKRDGGGEGETCREEGILLRDANDSDD